MNARRVSHFTHRLLAAVILATMLVSLLVTPQPVRATAAWMWHGGNIVAGGAATDNVLPDQDVTVWMKVGYDGWVNEARIYYTTDGSVPDGSYDAVSNGTKVTMVLDHTESDSGGTIGWWKGTIPAQAEGTQVRYKIAAWHSGGGDIVYAESVTGKVLNTSAEATTFGYYVSAYESPNWAKNAVIYQVFIDRFFDADTGNNIDCVTDASGYCQYDIFDWNGGDLSGVQSRIDYLQYLGINTLWLSPVYENPPTQIGSEYDTTPGVIKNYHGYEAQDFTDVEDNFGLNSTLGDVIDAAHAAGMKVILDFVPNHSSNQHAYFKDASDNCTSSAYYRWYKFGTTDSDGKIVAYDDAQCVSGHSVWWGDNDNYSTFFGVKEMPQLDNDYGPARQATIDQALLWVNDYDIDGLRLDYAPGPSHSFWLAFRAAVKAADPSVYLVGEVWTGGGAAERKEYEGELDGVLSFDHNDLFLKFFAWRNIDVDDFDAGLAHFEGYYDAEYVLPTFLDNHDKDRFLFEAGQSTDRLKLAFIAQMTLDQPPVIYYGTEVGLTQSEASAGKPERSRGRMLWSGYLSSPPAGWDGSQQTEVRDLVKQLIGLRLEHSALRTGERVTLYRHNSNGTFAYRRTDSAGNVVVAFNNSDSSHQMTIPNLSSQSLGWADGTVVEDKLSGSTYTVSSGKVVLNLSAMRGAVLVPVSQVDTATVNFTINGYTTQYGEDLYIVGSVPELGEWDAAQAIPLSWVDSDTWSGPVNFTTSRGQTVEYKYIVKSGGSVVWEPGSNHSYAVPNSGTDNVVDTWGAGGGASTPATLGATLVDEGINFTLYSENATRVELSIFDSATADAASATYLLTKDTTNHVWSITVPGAEVGTYYGYRLWGPNWPYDASWTPGSSAGFGSHVDSSGNRFNPNKLLMDPYAKAVTGEPDRVWDDADGAYHYAPALWGGTDANAFLDSAPVMPKSVVVDNTFDWSGDVKPSTSIEDSVVYEVHLRGFTRADDTIAAADQGTYDGFAAKAAYLKELGVTAVELLPVHEYPQYDDPIRSHGATEDRVNYWGYMTTQFFAPNREYLCPDMDSCTYANGEQVAEFKAMVKALHAEGIEVWLDVVFNHTAEGGVNGDGAVKYYNLRGIDNQNYYTLGDDRTTYWETTGTGNNVNGSRAAARQMIVDSLSYWIDEMHIDGFRFDLAYELGREGNDGRDFTPDALLLQEIGALGQEKGVKMVAEAWDTAGYGVGQFPSGWTEWNGKMRDTTRRFTRGDDGQIGKLGTAITANEDGFGVPPESLNFVIAHDGFTLNDLVSYNTKVNGVGPCNPSGADPDSGSNDNDSWDSGGDEALRRQQIRNFAVQMFTDQGVPMIVAGDEFRRTQYGNNNGYMADNTCGWIDWQRKVDYADTYDFFRTLIAFRKTHPALRRTARFAEADSDGDGYKDLTWHGVTPDTPDWGTTSHTLAYLLDGSAAETGDSADAPDLYVAYNAYWGDLTFTLPAPPNGKAWDLVVDTASWAEGDGNVYFDPAIAAWNDQPLPSIDGSQYTLQARSSLVLAARPADAAEPMAGCDGVLINEILPANSTYTSDWVEFYNPGDATANLSGCVVDDITGGGSSPYTIPDGTTIASGGYWLLERGGVFNNGGDTVNFIAADGTTVIDSYAYGSTGYDESWYRAPDGGTWQSSTTTSPTPNASNGGSVGGGSGSCSDVVINEIMPANSSYTSDWIELYNPTSGAIDLDGCVVDDITSGGGSPYTIPDGTSIAAGGYWLLERGGVFNNGGDTVNFIAADGTTVIDSYTYGSTGYDESWYRAPDGGTWQSSTTASPTPNASNGGGSASGSCSDVVINEIMPANSTYTSDWIELYNPTSGAIDLDGCVVDDITSGGGSPYTIPDGTSIAAGGYWLLERGGVFNNGGDTVNFIAADGTTVIDSYTYGSTGYDESWYRAPDGGTWQSATTTSPTPNASNGG